MAAALPRVTIEIDQSRISITPERGEPRSFPFTGGPLPRGMYTLACAITRDTRLHAWYRKRRTPLLRFGARLLKKFPPLYERVVGKDPRHGSAVIILKDTHQRYLPQSIHGPVAESTSSGCLRVPEAALALLSTLPPGTLISVSSDKLVVPRARLELATLPSSGECSTN